MNVELEHVDEVLLHYDIGTCKEVINLSTGYANFNYRVITKMGYYLYRIFKEKNLQEIVQEMSLLETLRKTGFPAAYPIKRNDEQYVSVVRQTNGVIYEFIHGKEPEINAHTVGAIARLTARLAMVKVEPAFERSNGINISTCESMLNEMDLFLVEFPDLYSYFVETTHRLAPFVGEDLPCGVVHGDLFPDNTILGDNGVLAAIDFEEYAVDYLLFDVGMTINGFCFYDNRLDLDLLKIFLHEYETIRPLTQKENELLPHYIQWTAHGMLSWHLLHFEKTNAKQVARVYELMQRVEALHQKESFS